MEKSWQVSRERLADSFGDMPLYPAAVRIVDWLELERPKHFSIEDAMRVAEVEMTDTIWIGTVLSYPAELVRAEVTVADGVGLQVPIPSDRLAEAHRTGVLRHPSDGREIRDWEASAYVRYRTELPDLVPAPSP